MTEETTGEWLECIVDKDYEIYSECPYPIRRKGTDKVISEWIDKSTGYVICCLNRKHFKKHRIIGQQFIPNDEPEHKTQVDHINHNRTDNRIANLRWVSNAENQRNRSASRGGRQYTFLDELNDTAEPLEFYNQHEFDDLWIDYGTQKLYLFNGIKYRELLEHQKGQFSRYFVVHDTEGKRVMLYHSKLFD